MTELEKITTKRLALYTGHTHPELAEEIAAHLGIHLGQANIVEFANGEIRPRFAESVRGCDVFVMQSHYGVDGRSINDSIIEQLTMIDAAYRAREKTIQDTLTTAQSVVEQLKRTAIKESETLVVDAELRAEKIVAEARERRAELANEIREQRYLRQRLEVDLRRTLEGYGKLIDAFASSDPGDDPDASS